MGALDRSDSRRVFEPILVRSHSSLPPHQQHLPRFYGGFEHQKRKWESVHRRSHRIRWISYAQIALGLFASLNYLWVTNIFAGFVGCVGMLAYRSEKLSWTLVYLLVCMMEFMRNLLLAPHLYERYLIPHYQFSAYEYFQVAALIVQEGVLVPAAFCVVFAAATTAANPLW